MAGLWPPINRASPPNALSASMFRMRTVKIYVIHDEVVRSAIPVAPEPASRIRHENETKPFDTFVRHLQSPWSDGVRHEVRDPTCATNVERSSVCR